MLERLKERMLLKAIREGVKEQKHHRASLKFNEMKKIAMVVDGSSKEAIDFAKRYAEKRILAGKYIELLAYVPRKDKFTSYSLPFFTDEETNWYRKPKSNIVRNFMDSPFDLLINFSPELILPLEYICALSKAKFVVCNGNDHLTDHYDCLIMVNDIQSPDSFMDNVQHYLNLQVPVEAKVG